MSRVSSSLLSTLCLVAAACHDSSGDDASPLALGRNDLGPGVVAGLEDGVLVYWRAELGTDLNGDGDGDDTLLEILDLRSGRRVTVPDVAGVDENFVGGGAGFVTFLVPESGAGRDLNRDGDTSDLVVHVHDVRRGTTRNLELATFSPLVQDGALVAMIVPEVVQGLDLDGNGRLDGWFPFVYEAELGRLTRIPVAVHDELILSDHRVAFYADESVEGDLNGDGDEGDPVVQVYDVRTGQIHDSRRACDDMRLDGALLVLQAQESENGFVDLNLNGRDEDLIVELIDLEGGPVRMTSHNDGQIDGIGGGLVVLGLENDFQPREHRIYDRLTDTMLPLGPWSSSPFDRGNLSARRHAYMVNELEADSDLDGDGELFDDVLHVFDARSGLGRNTGRAVYGPPQLDEHRVVFLGLATPQDMRPPTHTSVHLLDLRTGDVVDTGLMATDVRLVDERLILATPEAWQGVDLDGDGRLDDTVLRVHDLRTGRTFDTGLSSVFSDALEGDVLAVNALSPLGDRVVVYRLR